MLASLLSLDRSLVVLDCETTGLVAQADRIVELAFEVHRPDGKIDEWRSLVNPGVPIPAAVTRVHGITDEDMQGCRKCGKGPGDTDAHVMLGDDPHTFAPIPTFAQVAAKLAKGFSDCDFCGKRVRFDLEFLAEEFRRAGVPWSYADACVIDADRLEAIADPRSLTSLVKKHLGEDMSADAHSALGDVRWTSRLIAAQLQAYETVLPRSLRKLHEMSWPGFVDSEGRVRRKDGVVSLSFGKWKDQPIERVPVSYWEWVAKSEFSGEFKRIAEGCAKGVFPK